MKTSIATIIILLAFTPGIKSQVTAPEIVARSEKVMKAEGFESRSKLTITDEKQRVRVRENITASLRFDDGSVRRIIRFLAPADIAGTTMLIHDYDSRADDMWIYLPALSRTRRMVSSEKSRSFMGSDFTNGDMTTPPSEEFNHTIVQEESRGEYWVVESTPVSDQLVRDYGFSSKKTIFRKSNYTVVSIMTFDATSKPLREVSIEKLHPAPGGEFIIEKMTARDLRRGSISVLELSEIKMSSSIDRSLFDPATLGR